MDDVQIDGSENHCHVNHMKVSRHTQEEATIWVLIALLFALVIAAAFLFSKKIGL